MHDDTISLRQPEPTEIRTWFRVLDAAFADDVSDAEFEDELRQFEPDRMIGAVEGDAWVGAGAGYSLRLTVPGGVEVGAVGITAIGVMPSHRRRGILRQVMGWLVDQAGERDEPVAILWASETAIYQRFGFGIGTLQGTFDIERSRTRFAHPVEALGRMRLVDRDEALELIPPVYDAMRSRIPGAVSRLDVKWRHQLLDDAEWTRRGNGRKFIVVLELDGEVHGYAIYRVKTDWDERGPNNTLIAVEVLGLDAAAERWIWEWLFGIDLVGHIKGWRTRVPQPLLLQLAEPRRLGLAVREGMLLRILDLPAALEGRGYDTAGTVTFEVSDELRPSNAGRWRLTVTGGSAPVARSVASVASTTDEPDLIVDTMDLASVYLGAFRFADLALAGRVRECRAGAIAAADRIFASDTAPWCSTMF
jgi:predicted acetyltransferase